MKNKLNTEFGESDSPKSRAKCPTCHDPLSGNGFILWCENGHVFEHPAASVSAWLLEDGSEKPRYIMADESGLGWTDDIGEALRMARRADCEALAKIVEDAWHIRQHSFPVSACGRYVGEPGGNCTRCGLIAYEHEGHVKAELREAEATRQPSQDGMILVNAAEYNALRECMVGAADDALVLSKRLSVLVQQWRESADKSEDHIGRDRDENGNSRNENECHMRDMRMCADKLEEILKAEHSEPAKETGQ